VIKILEVRQDYHDQNDNFWAAGDSKIQTRVLAQYLVDCTDLRSRGSWSSPVMSDPGLNSKAVWAIFKWNKTKKIKII